ncbi:hypothetical protein [Sphaerisporangium corydalis]|uniref:Uncharacterized protein n=1 Tax=Sphaerisporangium corydalis TaxID=1441875 RepID=A0ABV9EPX3_9ACTN|nr:hypothetical protein [Sphaerisporangium corydalis]
MVLWILGLGLTASVVVTFVRGCGPIFSLETTLTVYTVGLVLFAAGIINQFEPGVALSVVFLICVGIIATIVALAAPFVLVFLCIGP